MLVSVCVLFLLLSSGSFLVCAYSGKKFEQTVPLTIAGIVLLLFLFGLLGILYVGVIVTIVLCALCMGVAGVVVTKQKAWKCYMQNIFTPGFCVFACMFFAFAFFTRNKLTIGWDEFSHWIDSVKAMTMLDDFVTNPASNSAFDTYPPAMALFQYFCQKVYLLLTSATQMHEGLAFFAWQLFFFAWLIPFFEKFSFRKPFPLLAMTAAVFLTPMVFYDVFDTAYIDPFMSLPLAGGFAVLFLQKDKDASHYTYIFMGIAILVLSKDSGILFAAFLAGATILDALLCKKGKKHFLLCSVGAVLAVLLPKVLWKMEIALSGATPNFSDSVDVFYALKCLFSGEDPFFSQMLKIYLQGSVKEGIHITILDIPIPFALLFVLQSLLLVMLCVLYTKKEATQKRRRIAMIAIVISMVVIYFFGLCITYMTNFTRAEALVLASYGRYLKTAFLAVSLLIVLVAGSYLNDHVTAKKLQRYLSIGATCCFVLLVSVGLVLNYITGANAEISQTERAKLAPIAEEICRVAEADSLVWFISQGDNGYHYWITKFNCRPIHMDNRYGDRKWSMGKDETYDCDISVTEWMQILASEYDYVAIYKLNDYFYEEYSEVFADPDDIVENAVYRVDKTTGTLTRCR